MECPRHSGEGATLMTAYVAQKLEPDTQIALERHLSACADCRALAAQQRAVWEALDAWKPEPVSMDFDRKLYQRISEEAETAWWRRLSRVNWPWTWRPAMPVAAACAAIAIAFLLKSPVIDRPQRDVPQKVSIEQVERALDDVEMLKQVSLAVPADGTSDKRM